MKKIGFLIVLFFCLSANIACATGESVIDDMRGSHEGVVPWGVPKYYDWGQGPVTKSPHKPDDFFAFTSWLQFGFLENNPGDYAEIKITYLKAYVLAKKSGDEELNWYLVQDSSQNQLDGSLFDPTFVDDEQKEIDIVRQDDGVIIASLEPGWMAHFWPRNRADLSGFSEISEVFVIVEAQLISSQSKTDIYFNAGFDWWRDLFVGWDELNVNNTCGVQSKFKKLTEKSKRFYAHTLTESELRQNPLPDDDKPKDKPEVYSM